MTQLSPTMFPMSLYCRLDGKLSRWDTECEDPGHAIAACQEELKTYRGKRSTILALVHLPVVNTQTD